MQYQFNRSIVVEGVPYEDGDVVDESEIPAGSLGPLLRCKHLAPWQEPQLDGLPEMQPFDDQQPDELPNLGPKRKRK